MNAALGFVTDATIAPSKATGTAAAVPQGAPGKNLRRGEAAERVGVHPNTLYSWAQRGLVEYVELPNGEVRYRESSIEALRDKLGL